MNLDGQAVVHDVELGGALLGFRATNIRRQRTGIHARIDVLSGPHILGYDTFNIERHGERVRLANACASSDCPQNMMRVFMDDFCAQVWPTWVTQFAPEIIEPNLDNLQATQYLLSPYIVEGAGTILFAPPGQGKSYFALLMAQSVNQGVSAIWRVEKRRVLYLNLERSRLSLERRLLLVNQALDLPPEAPMLMSNARGKTLAHVTESLGRDFDMVVLDSLSRSGAGSMIDDEVANGIMDTVNGLAPTWLVIAHTPRADSSHTFGSQMFDGAADLTLSLKSVRNANDVMGVQVAGHESNDVPVPKPATYAMSFDKYGLSEFRTAMASEFPVLVEDGDMDRVEMIREYLLQIGEADITEITAHLGVSRSTAQRDLDDGHFVGRRKVGKRILYSVKAS